LGQRFVTKVFKACFDDEEVIQKSMSLKYEPGGTKDCGPSFSSYVLILSLELSDKSMSLEYEPASEPPHISAKWLFKAKVDEEEARDRCRARREHLKSCQHLLSEKWLKPRPDSGRDCLIRAGFVRQRLHQQPAAGLPTDPMTRLGPLT